ncbi:major facilitator superfamily protein [Stylonychia lemnae]|uniref:Major facilitator superfamily protein n=1 Tax=Stylonychia lemnae TaxID=5949 RepID=A0A078A9B7_STYLE|nr:major facilitator superfamily protein [Stylonychia lemnae]|eukprot:CDW78446.1 major facilitator superfamily protein [Stylonychia lemnae]
MQLVFKKFLKSINDRLVLLKIYVQNSPSIRVKEYDPDLESDATKRKVSDDIVIDIQNQNVLNDKLVRKNVLLSCLFQIMMINTLFLNIENILPTWIPDHFPEYHAMQISFILMQVSQLGATSFIKNEKYYLYISIFLRFIQGIGSAQVNTSCFAIITFVFQDDREKYIGMAESASGFGLMVGPIVGGLLYNSFGYFSTFFIFGIILAANLMIAYLFCPDYLNKSIDETDQTMNPKGCKEVSFKMFLVNRRANFAFIGCIFVCISMSYNSAFLTDVLRTEKNIDPYYHGFVLSFPMLTYTVSTIYVCKILKYFPRRIFIMISLIILATATFFQGPSQILNIPESNTLMILGFGLCGIGQAFVFIPLLPEAIESVYIQEDIVEGENEFQDQILNDLASALYSTYYSIGMILAPTIGGYIYESIGYRNTCDFVGIITIIFTVMFFTFNVGFKIIKQEKLIAQRQANLKAKYQERLSNLTSQDEIVRINNLIDDKSAFKRNLSIEKEDLFCSPVKLGLISYQQDQTAEYIMEDEIDL